MNIPIEFQDLLQKKPFAHLATVNPDNSPQVTPVWIEYDQKNNLILINTAEGRKKTRNVRLNPKVAISIIDLDYPYRYLTIQGDVIEISEDQAEEHIDKLTRRYLNKDKFSRPEDQVRLILKIQPTYVHTS